MCATPTSGEYSLSRTVSLKYESVTESSWYLSFNHWSDVLHSSIVNNITIASSDKANDVLNHEAWTRDALHGKNFVANF